MPRKRKQWGGRREGAGRKPASPKGRTVVVSASMPPDLLAKLDNAAAVRGSNRSAIISEAIRRLVRA